MILEPSNCALGSMINFSINFVFWIDKISETNYQIFNQKKDRNKVLDNAAFPIFEKSEIKMLKYVVGTYCLP